MSESIPALLERFVQGDDLAFGELMARFQKKVYFLAYQTLGNHLDADEVMQETFVRIYRKRKELEHVANFTSFVIRVASNYAIDLLRKRKGQASTEDLSELPSAVQIDLSRRVRTPGEIWTDKHVMMEIQKALDTLPPRQKLTAVLHDVEGYSKAEIAVMLDCPEATVRSNLHIARTKLKKILAKRLARKEQ
ncbi:MAG: RNA polymerase sigma factor [candidate division Zixibacteria bacterium]|nr:RNA polymerase sigma factor [candidate division Zixibacteria bacterium]